MTTSPTTIKATRLYIGEGDAPLENHAIAIDGAGCIASIEEATDTAATYDIIAPGFIDLQINGAGGVLFNDTPDTATIEKIAATARKGGAAHIMPTFITAPDCDYKKAMTAIGETDAPEIIGLHLEGPFLSPDKPGIHPAQYIRKITDEDIKTLTDYPGRLLLTLAPEEIKTEKIKQLTQAGIIVFAGHSLATADDMAAAMEAGLSGVTHLFNAMTPMTARAPGIIGTAFSDTRLTAGIIADGHHVHPANLKLAAGNMAGRLFLVSDSMPPYGTDMKSFSLYGAQIESANGRLVKKNSTTLAGANIGMDDAVRKMAQQGGVNLADAIRMASLVPARVMGLDDTYGAIAPGRPASLTCLDDNLRTVAVYVHGRHYPVDTLE